MAMASDGKDDGAAAVGSYLAGRYAQSVQDWPSAASYISDALAKDPNDPSLQRRMFFLSLADGDYDRAVALAPGLASGDASESGFARLMVIADLIRREDYKTALLRVKALPDDQYLRLAKPLLTAWVAVGTGAGSAEALAILETSPAISRIDTWLTLHSAMLAEAAGDMQEAARWYDRAARLSDETSLRLADALGAYAARSGKTKDVGQDGAPLDAPGQMTVAVGAAQTLFDLANALDQQDAPEYALCAGRIALFLRPDFPLANLLLGDVQTERGRHEEALGFYRAVMNGSDRRLVRAAWLRAVDSLENLDRPKEALAEANRLLANLPDDVDALVRVGDLQRVANDNQSAVDAYTSALDRMPPNGDRRWAVLYGRALAHDRNGDWASAEADLLAAIALNPQDPTLLNYLGYTWADKGINLDRARSMIEAAVAARPHDGFIVDSLGWVLFRQGDLDGAIGYLERAIVLQPLDPTINDHLGDVYWQAGRRLEAKFQWERALKYAGEEDGDLKLAVEQKLKDKLGPHRAAEATPSP